MPSSTVPAPATILVSRALGLGDFLTSVPALRALEREFHGHRLYLAAPSGHTELLSLARLRWEVRPTPALGTPSWPPHAEPPDLAVNLHGSGPQSITALQALRPKRLWTFAHRDVPEVSGPEWPGAIHDVDLWCRLLEHFDVEADRNDLRLEPVRPRQPDPEPGLVVVHPGAASPARRWPVPRFAEVIRTLAGRGHRIVLTGTPDERPRALHVARAAGLDRSAVVAGRTSLTALAALVADAALVICGDTGVGHLATAYATPSVLLFGPVSPELWGPRIDREMHVRLWAGVRGDPHGERTDPGLLRITPHDVLAAAEQAMARTVPNLPPAAAVGSPQRTPASAVR